MYPNSTPSTDSLQRRRPRHAGIAVALWIVAVSVGWCAMTAYAFKAAPMGAPPTAAWPADARLVRDAALPTLVMFLHPKCPCSQATLAELERLWTTPSGAAAAGKLYVVVATPFASADDWLTTPLIERSRRLSRSALVVDRGGVLAARFGATSSGTVMVFAPTGERVFAGGVTASRGHEGANAGSRAVASLLAGESTDVTSLPVFGCRLVTSPQAPAIRPSAHDMVTRNQQP